MNTIGMFLSTRCLCFKLDFRFCFLALLFVIDHFLTAKAFEKESSVTEGLFSAVSLS